MVYRGTKNDQNETCNQLTAISDRRIQEVDPKKNPQIKADRKPDTGNHRSIAFKFDVEFCACCCRAYIAAADAASIGIGVVPIMVIACMLSTIVGLC